MLESTALVILAADIAFIVLYIFSVTLVCFSETQQMWLSFISCIAGGVFLAACLLDIVPDFLKDMKEVMEAKQITVCGLFGILKSVPSCV